MADWTPEARDYLDGYLRQVGALARGQGDDAEDIVAGLREHVVNEAAAESGSLVTLDALRKTLAAVGTPEQVVSPDFSLSAAAERAKHADPGGGRNASPQKRRSGCVIAVMVFLAVAVLVAIAVPVMLFGLFTATYVSTGTVVPGVEIDTETGYPVAVLNRMKAIAVVQQDFRTRRALDVDGDGTPDYGTMRDIIDEVTLPFEIDARGAVSVEGYVFRIETTPSGEPSGPAFLCTVRPPVEEMGEKQWAQIDQTGELRMIEPRLGVEAESEGDHG